MQNKITVCRTLFCPTCAAKGWPHQFQKFVIYKGSREETQVRTVKKYSFELQEMIGFTPHILTSVKKITKEGPHKGKIKFSVACTMDGCGIDAYIKDGLFNFNFVRQKFMYFTDAEVAALIKYTDEGYHLDKASAVTKKYFSKKKKSVKN